VATPAGQDEAAAGEPLALAHREELEPLLAARWAADEPPERTLSDPWFANLYLFRTAHDWRIHRGPHPCIGGRTYDGARILVPLFDLASAPHKVLRTMLRDHDAFAPLSDTQVARLDPSRFQLQQRRDDADFDAARALCADMQRRQRKRAGEQKGTATDHGAVRTARTAPRQTFCTTPTVARGSWVTVT